MKHSNLLPAGMEMIDMEPDVFNEVADALNGYDFEIEDVILHGNDAIGDQEMSIYRKQVNQGEVVGEWLEVQGCALLVEKVIPLTISTGFQYRELDAYYIAHIWG